MSVFLSILMTLIILNVIVVIHEFGHYITAKKFGVGIKEFSIGMGPIIFQRSKKKNSFVFFRKSKTFPENEFKFSVRALPIGGFVSLKGEGEECNDADSFSMLKPWKRLVVFLAGAFMNLVLGLICIAIIGTFYIDCDITTKVSVFNENKTTDGTIIASMSDKDGLMVGDEIIRINGNRTFDVTDIQYELALANDTSVDVEVIRNGEKVLLKDVHFPNQTIDGLTSMYMDFKVLGEEKTFTGTLKYIGNSTFAAIKMVYRSLYGLVTGKIPASSMSGIVGVTAAVSETVKSATSFFDLSYQFFYLMFLLTINIGLFNVLPIPALDGGQSCACVFEMITKKKIPEKIYNTVTTVFFILLFGLMIVISLKDVWSIIF